MKKFLLNRIREGQFDPSSDIQRTIDTLNTSYRTAKQTVDTMHKDDELTLRESMTREFRYYSTSMQKAKLKQFEDEHKKMFQLRKELTDLFGIDVWDDVILNCEFDSLEEMYSCFKNYVRENYD